MPTRQSATGLTVCAPTDGVRKDLGDRIGGRIDSLRTELGNVRSDYPASASSSRFGRQPLLRVRAFGRVEPAYYVDAVACRPADGPWRHGVGAGPSGRQKRALSEVRQLTMRSLLGAACVTPTRSTSRETRDHGFREFRTKSGLECQLSRGSLDYKNGNSCTGLPTSARIGWPGKRHDSRRRSLAVPSEATEFSFHTLGDPEDVGALPNLVHLDLIGSVAAVRESGLQSVVVDLEAMRRLSQRVSGSADIESLRHVPKFHERHLVRPPARLRG